MVRHSSSLLSIQGLHVSVGKKEIVRGVTLTIREGEVHAVMGPNGAGKSTLVHALMGHPGYEITKGTVSFRGKNLLKMQPHERAQVGLFLAFQYPREIAGVSVRSFLFAAYKAQMAVRNPQQRIISPIKFQALLKERMDLLHLDPSFAERSLNHGFSGGEKKKAEMLQLHILLPLLSLLDETDSGLDLDALRTVAEGLSSLRKQTNIPFTALLVTHYARILDVLKPDHIHVMVKGRIVESGGAELSAKLEKHGYRSYAV